MWRQYRTMSCVWQVSICTNELLLRCSSTIRYGCRRGSESIDFSIVDLHVEIEPDVAFCSARRLLAFCVHAGLRGRLLRHFTIRWRTNHAHGRPRHFYGSNFSIDRFVLSFERKLSYKNCTFKKWTLSLCGFLLTIVLIIASTWATVNLNFDQFQVTPPSW